jgi:small subunit ribosomal protein S9
LTNNEYCWGTGRRKTAVARIRVCAGRGSITINSKPLNEYFTEAKDRQAIQNVLEVTGTSNSVDILGRVNGGGSTGQAGAVVLGVARALVKMDEAHEHILRENHLLTRDGRAKERKKYGRRGARRSFQFSKR